ncbi:MAG: 2-amino-4-hydroxy-6-hydroxymethyldihydropteridine diphosphokinase [Coriobacteriia bacterium]|nr:2-amino-4-hydroxy-6-hydroxymethyldihydropteridine diphosphokinase [Coriobacteriia bacterium]
MTNVFVGLGSNLGDRVGSIAAAVREMAATEGVRVLDVSSVVESEAWGVEDQPRFANAVARLDVRGEADAFLGTLKAIEERLGRRPGVRYGPRPIDLDILLFGDEEWDSPELTIPHPRLLERDFAVTPLLRLAPDAVLPDGTPVTRENAVEGRIVGEMGPVPGFGGPG